MGEYADMEIEREIGGMAWSFSEGGETECETIRGVVVKGETEKAWLLDFGGGDTHWIPKSVCSLGGGDLTAPTWLLAEKASEKANLLSGFE